jgi:hypothetical protein
MSSGERPLSAIVDELVELAGAGKELELHFGPGNGDPDRPPSPPSSPMSPECRRLLEVLQELEVDPADLARNLPLEAPAKRLTVEDFLARLPPEIRNAPPPPPPPPVAPEELDRLVKRAVNVALEALDRGAPARRPRED